MLGKKKKVAQSNTLQDLQNSEEKNRLEINRKKKNNTVGPKKAAAQATVRIFIWGFICLVLLVGIMSIVKSKQPKIVKTVVEYNFAPCENDTAKAYAEAFTKEYLTFTRSKKEEYIKRIGDFIPTQLLGLISLDTIQSDSVVRDAIVWKVEKLDNDHSNITVRATVISRKEIPASTLDPMELNSNMKYEENTKVVYVKVPIRYVEGQYIVDDYPVFDVDMEKPEIDLLIYEGEKSVEESVKKKLREVLENFFDTYSKGNKVQISYYMLDNKQVKGLEGKFLFENIRTLEIYESQNINEVVAVCEIIMMDPDVGTRFTQRYLVQLKNNTADKRWYVMSLQARGDIIKAEEQIIGGN